MSDTTWQRILDAAGAAAPFLPQPAGAIASIAIAIARALVGSGCRIHGCPADVERELLSIPPEDEAMQRAKQDAHARVRGLDRASIDARFRPRVHGDHDELPRRGPIAGIEHEADLADRRRRADGDAEYLELLDTADTEPGSAT